MKLSALELREVVTEEGQRLGRAFDVRLHRKTGEQALPDTVDALVYGTLGLLERLGVRHTRTRTIRWMDVVRITPRTIVVRSRRGAPEK